jgi:adenylate cyclase
VIARNSTFTYKGKPVDVRQVGRHLGVRFVLEGSVQRTKERLRVNAQLIEAATARHVWAERYDRKLDDVFDIQDDIAQHVVTELDVNLLQGEQARTWRKTTRNRAAYELYLKGREHHAKFTREDMAKAQSLFHEALRLDPNFAMALVFLGWTHYMQGISAWSADYSASNEKAVELAERAIGIDPGLADAYAMMGNALIALGRYPEAIVAADKALAAGPNQADNLALVAWILAPNGRSKEAVALVEAGMRLNPLPPEWYYGALGDALLFSGQAQEAAVADRKCIERAPDFLWCQLGLTVALVGAGQLDQARAHAREAMRINLTITAEDNSFVRSTGVPEQRNWVIDALRQAGLK